MRDDETLSLFSECVRHRHSMSLAVIDVTPALSHFDLVYGDSSESYSEPEGEEDVAIDTSTNDQMTISRDNLDTESSGTPSETPYHRVPLTTFVRIPSTSRQRSTGPISAPSSSESRQFFEREAPDQ